MFENVKWLKNLSFGRLYLWNLGEKDDYYDYVYIRVSDDGYSFDIW